MSQARRWPWLWPPCPYLFVDAFIASSWYDPCLFKGLTLCGRGHKSWASQESLPKCKVATSASQTMSCGQERTLANPSFIAAGHTVQHVTFADFIV
jgi:hypothetical protein